MKNKTKDQLWSLNAAQPVGDLNSKSGVLSPGTPETPGWGLGLMETSRAETP